MNKKRSRFACSQAAHRRLHRTHTEKMRTNDYAWVPAQYHFQVVEKQKKVGKILSLEERRKIWRSTERDFFN